MSDTTDLKHRLRNNSSVLTNSLAGPLFLEAADEIERLEHNQMSHGYTSLAQAAALQAQEADARGRYAKKLEQKCEQLTDALTKAIGLQDALLTEMGDMQRELQRPPNLQLLSAKRNFDTAMHTLLGEDEPDAD